MCQIFHDEEVHDRGKAENNEANITRHSIRVIGLGHLMRNVKVSRGLLDRAFGTRSFDCHVSCAEQGGPAIRVTFASLTSKVAYRNVQAKRVAQNSPKNLPRTRASGSRNQSGRSSSRKLLALRRVAALGERVSSSVSGVQTNTPRRKLRRGLDDD